MEKKINLLIADDHQTLLEGLNLMLKDVPSIEIVSTASNGVEVLLKMSSYYVDVLLMDIQMPQMDGYETAKIVAQKFPDTKILILSMHSEKIFIEKMYQAGVAGYLLKSSSKKDIVSGIEDVFVGKQHFPPDVMKSIFMNEKAPPSSSIEVKLTKRENEIVSLIVSGLSNPEIAQKLFLSIETVKTHRKNLMFKLNVKNTAGLVKYAINFLALKKSSED